MKRCYKCKIEKDESEFHKAKNRKDGLFDWCKCCVQQQSIERKPQRKQYLKENKDKIKQQRKQYCRDHKEERKIYKMAYNKEHSKEISIYNKKCREKNHEDRLLRDYKIYDKKKNFICDLTEQWIKDNITSKSCVYCDDTENLGCDRIDNHKGHTMNNCVPCCKECNETRMDNYTFEEMKILGYSIRKIKYLRQEDPQTNLT